jgi:hypothetical protein
MGYAKIRQPLLVKGITEKHYFAGQQPGTATVGIQSSELDISLLQKLSVTLTTAQVEAMYATPVNIIPAPAAGQVIMVDCILVETKPGTTQFTAGGAVTFQYHGTSINPHTGTVTAAQMNAASPGKTLYLGPNTSGTIDLTSCAGLGLDITNATQAFATGNGTPIITIWYSIVTL